MRIFQKRVVDGFRCGIYRARISFALSDTQNRVSLAFHNGFDVRKVDVHFAGSRNKIGNSLHALTQHVVGNQKRLLDGSRFFHDIQKILIGNNDKRIDLFVQFCNTVFGEAHFNAAFKMEGFGNDADG